MDLATVKTITGIAADVLSIGLSLVAIWSMRKFLLHVAKKAAEDIKKL